MEERLSSWHAGAPFLGLVKLLCKTSAHHGLMQKTLGSDCGGSLRVPAHNCGIVSIRPTSGRVPLHGQAVDGGLPGVVGVHNASGFMTRSVDDLELVWSTVLSKESLAMTSSVTSSDPRFVPIPWNPLVDKSSLTFGWYLI